MNGSIAERPTLRAWLDEYAAIEQECVEAFASQGVSFAPRGSHEDAVFELRRRAFEQGARFLNGGASVSHGFLSSACRACVGDRGSRTFYLNLRCNRDCFFCFNPNQADYEEHLRHDTPWREDLAKFSRTERVSHIGLTGGEPLLFKERAYEFFERASELNPDAHLRLYTSGTSFDDDCCTALAERGLSEIRFSIKLDEGEEAVSETLRRIELARRRIPDVMVEMPVVPGTLERMKRLLVELDERGVRGINLLEFCYPLRDWSEFAMRGFRVKNPPFEVLYDYAYAGGLPIAGSEEESLELLLYAMEEGLGLGVHYCSLANKNRDQVLWLNRTAQLDTAVYELDPEDWFYKAAKVFDEDVATSKKILDEGGHPFRLEEDGSCLVFHPALRPIVAAHGAVPALSYNVVETKGGESYVRELKLALPGELF